MRAANRRMAVRLRHLPGCVPVEFQSADVARSAVSTPLQNGDDRRASSHDLDGNGISHHITRQRDATTETTGYPAHRDDRRTKSRRRETSMNKLIAIAF